MNIKSAPNLYYGVAKVAKVAKVAISLDFIELTVGNFHIYLFQNLPNFIKNLPKSLLECVAIKSFGNFGNFGNFFYPIPPLGIIQKATKVR